MNVQNLGFEETAQLFGGKTFLLECVDEFSNFELGLAESVGASLQAAACGDECSGAVTKLKQIHMLQLGVGLGDGVVTDDKLLGESADSGHLVAVLQDTGFDGVADLLDQLKIERLAGGWIDAEDYKTYCTTDMVHKAVKVELEADSGCVL